jgi:hypothetical protein
VAVAVGGRRRCRGVGRWVFRCFLSVVERNKMGLMWVVFNRLILDLPRVLHPIKNEREWKDL